MTEQEKQLTKLRLIVATFQQKLADADLTVADARADLQLAELELEEKDRTIAELRDSLASAQALETAAKPAD